MRVAIAVLGCKVNFAEMSELGDRLERAGFEVVEPEAAADICVVNSCTVTAEADRKTRTLVHHLRRHNPGAHLVLTGCHVDNARPRLSAVPAADVAFGNWRKPEIYDYLVSTFDPAGSRPAVPATRRSRFFLKAQDGCDHRCTYCIVWKVRGPSRSRPLEDLLARAAEARNAGYQEVVLTGVDLGSWGRDLESPLTLATLVERLLDRVAPGRMRLSSINANDFTPALIELAAHPRRCPHFHIPLQSESDRVLKRMGRLYRRAGYLALVQALRERRPLLALTTDLIVGFPGEDEDDFQASLAVMGEAQFSGVHAFRYSPRAGTAAPRLGPPPPDAQARQRSALVHAQAERQQRAYEARFSGQALEVVWDRRMPGAMRGLSDNYISVFVRGADRPLGSREMVRTGPPLEQGLQGVLPVHAAV
jgi:threonylcarbamoyladenosine tRNA methylthiotransferase MtaB